MSARRWQEPNLARAPFVNERPVRRLAVTLWVLFAIVGGAGFWMSRTLRQETGTRLAELVRLSSESVTARERAATLERELRAADLPAQNERTEFLNRRLAERSFSWSNLLETLSQVMPRGVRLVRLAPEGFVSERRQQSAGARKTAATTRVALRVTGEAEETEALLEFVDRLFVHPAFDRPNLSRDTEKKDLKIQFELTVGYLPQAEGAPATTATTPALPAGGVPDAGAPGSAGLLSGAPVASPASAAAGAVAGAAAGGGAPSAGATRLGTSPTGAAPAGRPLPSGQAAARPSARAGGVSEPPSGGGRIAAPASGDAETAVDRTPSATASGGFAGVPVVPAAGSAGGGAAGGGTRPGVAAPPAAAPTSGTGPRFPANIMPTPLRPYASTTGGGR